MTQRMMGINRLVTLLLVVTLLIFVQASLLALRHWLFGLVTRISA